MIPLIRSLGCLTLAVSAPTLLGGCALLYEGKYDHDEGWRKATVAEVGLAATMTRQARVDCRRSMKDADIARTQFVRVTYREHHWPTSQIVPIPVGATLKVGDAVFVNRRRCELPMHAADPNAPTAEVIVPLWQRPPPTPR